MLDGCPEKIRLADKVWHKSLSANEWPLLADSDVGAAKVL
jgi:hypothetical protein